MKRNLLLFLFLIGIAFNIKSQAPAAFSYQIVVTNGQGKVLSNESVQLSISIINNNGVAVYREQFQRVTNTNGLLSLQIGKGDQILSGNLGTIDWSEGIYFLRVSIRTNDNSTLDLGDVQILSVPYALYAEKAKAPNLILNGNQLGIEGSSTTINLPGGGSDGLWQQNTSDGVYVNNKVSFKSGSSNYFQAQNSTAYGGGVLSLFENGQIRNGLGFGELATYSSSGLQLVNVSSPSNASDNGGVWIYGSGLTDAKATLFSQKFANSNSSKGTLLLRGGDNRLKAEISSAESTGNTGFMYLYGANEIENVGMGGLESTPNNGVIQTFDDNGNVKVQLYSYKENTGSTGRLYLAGTDGNIKTALGVDDSADAGSLYLYGQNGSLNVAVGNITGYPNTGGIWTYDGNENNTLMLSSLAGYPSNPYIALWNNGSQRGGFYVDTDGKSVLSVDRLIVDGYLRSAPVNLKSEYTLRSGTSEENTHCYVSTNEDEITLHGTASLQKGTAIIELPQDVSDKIDLTTMTVQVTPLSVESKGMAVTDKQTVSFKVQELMSGTGNYAFDWRLTVQVKTTLRSASRRIDMPEAAMPVSSPKKDSSFDKIIVKSKPEVLQPQKMIDNNFLELNQDGKITEEK
jgi:hypothetical protein